MSNSSIWPIDGPYQVLPLHGNEGVHHIPQSYSITETVQSDCFVSYAEHSLGKSYPSAEMKSVYFAGPADESKMNVKLHFRMVCN